MGEDFAYGGSVEAEVEACPRRPARALKSTAGKVPED
jgi:hypothetical protein